MRVYVVASIAIVVTFASCEENSLTRQIGEIASKISQIAERAEWMERHAASIMLLAEGWKRSPQGTLVHYFGTAGNWAAARSYCQSYGPNIDLATVLSNEQQQWLVVMMRANVASYAWIGANDREVEGQFRWASTNQTLAFTDWHAGQPDNGRLAKGPGDEDCVIMVVAQSYDSWQDAPCSNAYPFFCEQL